MAMTSVVPSSAQRRALLGVTAVSTLFTALWLIRRIARRARSGSGPGRRSKLHFELRVTTGADKGAVYQFQRSECITVGRRAGNTVCLPDTGISGSHFEVCYDASSEEWQLTDLGSLNGTLLNGVNIAGTVPKQARGQSRPLSTGDQISVGELTVVEVVCTPSKKRAQRNAQHTTGDVIAEGLMKRVRQPAMTATGDGEAAAPQPFGFDALSVSGCSIQQQGSRAKCKSCEDTFSYSQPVDALPLYLLCLCDGHCGDVTSAQVQKLLPDVLAAQLQARNVVDVADVDLRDVLRQAFLRIDELVVGEDGCTMTVVLLYSDGAQGVRIQSANVGDSAVVCADFSKMMKMHLTENHRVTHSAEQQRLRETGSLLTHNGTRLMGLNLSRSIGDNALKELNSGFVAEPYISKVHDVRGDDSLLLIMASDGLWDVTNANIVMRIAYRVLAEHPHDVNLVSQVLLEHALQRRSKDDITICVVLIDAAHAPDSRPGG
jgi:protein phosphatase